MSQSFEDRYYLTNPTTWQRCKRNIDLYTGSLAFLLVWFTKGRRIRKELKEAEEKEGILDLNKIMDEDYS